MLRSAIKRVFSQKSLIRTATDRCVLRLTGEDLNIALNGITTTKSNGNCLQHTLMLTSKGKLLADCIEVRPLMTNGGQLSMPDKETWLDVADSQKDDIVKHIKMHAFRKKLEIMDVTDKIMVTCLLVE